MNFNPYDIKPYDVLAYEGFEKEEISLYKPTEEEINKAKEQCPNIPIDANLSDLLGRQYKDNIRNHYRILKFMEWKTADGRCDVFIPQTTLYLIRGYDKKGVLKRGALKNKTEAEKEAIYRKFQSQVSRGIDYFTKMNVLKEIEGEKYIPHNIAKHYYVNKYNLNFVLNLYYEELAKDKKQSTKKKKTKKNLWGDIRLDAEIGVKADDYERIDDIYNALFQLYPQMLYFINEAKELNKNIPYEEEKIHFYPSLKIDSYGTLKKVGIRANSLICQYTSYDKQIEIDSNYIKDEKSKYREDYLDKRLGKNYEEFDVRASVPRVARAMHCNQPMGSMKEDIYNTLFGDFVDDYNKCFDTDFQKFEDKEVRRFFKMMFMILYFGGSPQRITEGILKREKVLIGIAKKYEKEQAIKENRKPNYEKIKQPFNNLYKKGIKTIDIITKWQQPLLEILNAKTDKDTSVFMDESCIYMLVYKSLKEMGIDVIQVYDGFYFPKGTQKSNDNPQGIDMEQLVNDAKDVYLKLSLAIKALVAIGGIAEGLKTDATDLTKYLIDNMGEIQKTIKNQG